METDRMDEKQLGVRLTAEIVDLDTGEILAQSQTIGKVPGADSLDIESKAGILQGIDEYETGMLKARDELMVAAREDYCQHIEKKNHS